MMKTRSEAALGGALVGLGLLAATTVPALAQQTPTPPPTPPTHQQMDEMMEAMGGAGTSQGMHEAMGQGDAAAGEKLMEQCVQMMGMMQQMQGMMGASTGGTQGMMGMDAQGGGPSMEDMMNPEPVTPGSTE